MVLDIDKLNMAAFGISVKMHDNSTTVKNQRAFPSLLLYSAMRVWNHKLKII
jgi:hypothetical protein